MRRKPLSLAEGKRFGTTKIEVDKSQFDIQRLLSKWDVEASQWTVTPESYVLRFRLNDRNYVFTIPKLADDPQEVRRLFRVIWWYLDTMLAAQDAGLFPPERTFMAFLEVSPGVTLSEALDDEGKRNAIRGALGGGQLQLEGGAG